MRDFDRPLSEEGIREAEAIGHYLQSTHLSPDLVFCSSSRRTRETLEHLLSAANYTRPPAIRYFDELYDGDVNSYLDIVEQAGLAETLLVVGHNPVTEELALTLAQAGPSTTTYHMNTIGFPTGALAIFDFPDGSSSIAPGLGEVIAFVKPADLLP